MKRLSDWLAQLPSTNARIAMTLGIVFGTAVRYWSSAAWVPSDGWLAFLAAMSGIDGAVFYAKRLTHNPELSGGASSSSGTDSPPSAQP